MTYVIDAWVGWLIPNHTTYEVGYFDSLFQTSLPGYALNPSYRTIY